MHKVCIYTHWNLLSVEVAKGLEFEIVICFVNLMTKNEKYITFTRALEELHIIDIPFKLSKNNKTKEKVDFSNSELNKYFNDLNIEYYDFRQEGGFFWVVGEKDEISEIIDKVIKKFKITGSYVKGKAIGYRAGWFTKSKK